LTNSQGPTPNPEALKRINPLNHSLAVRAEKAAADTALAWKAAADKAAARRVRPGRAGQVAANAWKSLEELVECVEVVHERRDGGNSAASVLVEVADFAALRKELEAGAMLTAASATVGEACRAAEEQFHESRMAAEVSQREVSSFTSFRFFKHPP